MNSHLTERTITSVSDDLICDSGSGTLSATASNGTVKWYNTITGGTEIASGATFSTPNVTTTKTYYVDATFNGCTTLTRTPVSVVVQQTPIPSANVIQTFCDLDIAVVSDLTAT